MENISKTLFSPSLCVRLYPRGGFLFIRKQNSREYHRLPGIVFDANCKIYPFTPEATMLCFNCFENRIDSRITGVMVTTARPMRAFCLVPVLFDML